MSENNINKEIKRIERIREELSNALNIAIGYRSVSQFTHDCRMVDVTLINDILKKKITVLPEREVLRVFERASEGRVTYVHLCQICEYPKYDPNEDRSWANYCPERGSIYMVDLGWNNQDSEQNGIRPCLVIQNDMGNKNSSTISVAPLTTKDKNPLPIHVTITTRDGMRQNSIICIEQTRVVSKRRLFYNSVPIKVLKLSDEKIREVNIAIEKQFGIIDLMYNSDHSSRLIKQIKTIEKNIQTKQSKDLLSVLNDKWDELTIYCSKYHKNSEVIVDEWERLDSYACAM